LAYFRVVITADNVGCEVSEQILRKPADLKRSSESAVALYTINFNISHQKCTLKD